MMPIVSAIDAWGMNLYAWATSRRGWQRFFRTITIFGDTFTLVLVCLCACWGFYRQQQRPLVWFSALVLTGSWLCNAWLKSLFTRSRPKLKHLVSVSAYSFPSGHAMISATFWPMLVHLLMRNSLYPQRVLLVGLTALICMLIGVSRIVLGVHYATDVLAGLMLGGMLCMLSIYSLRTFALMPV